MIRVPLGYILRILFCVNLGRSTAYISTSDLILTWTVAIETSFKHLSSGMFDRYLTTSVPFVVAAFSSSCSLKLRRLTLSTATFNASFNWPFGFPACIVIRRLYAGAPSWPDLLSQSVRSASSWSLLLCHL